MLPKSGERPPPIIEPGPEPNLWPTPQAELGVAHPPPSPRGGIPEAGDYERLRQRLIPPIAGLDVAHLHDSFNEMRGGSRHEALDVPAPRGALVVAVDDGPVKKLFVSQRGGLTVYQFDSAGEYCYYYAHLDRYAEGLKEGSLLKKGAVLGYVGTSGNAPPDTPHLHFAIFKLGTEKLWWQGTPLNPFEVYAAPR